MRSRVATATLAMAILAQTPIRPAQDLERGKRIWGVLCVQCHGVDGDLLGYDDIVPIAGIGRRYPPDVIGTLSGRFSGRVLYGRDREAIVDYMSSLRGGKGFPDPGWLVTPYLLERKAPHIHEFRILDTRDKEVYRSGHAANAVSIEPRACVASQEDTAQWLGRLGVTPTTVVLVYDEIGRGGPRLACADLAKRHAITEVHLMLKNGRFGLVHRRNKARYGLCAGRLRFCAVVPR
jgi:mono/diheme cytochrome c family protein